MQKQGIGAIHGSGDDDVNTPCLQGAHPEVNGVQRARAGGVEAKCEGVGVEVFAHQQRGQTAHKTIAAVAKHAAGGAAPGVIEGEVFAEAGHGLGGEG